MGLVILGAGGHGADLVAIAEAAGLDVLDVFDDEVNDHLPFLSAWSLPKSIGYGLGLNLPEDRRRFDHVDRVAPCLVHPASFIGPRVSLGPGSVVAPLATLANDVSLGRHTHVNAGSSLVRANVGDYTTIAPGVHVGGDVSIGAGVFVGIGARISNLVTIGDGAVIGAGAVVLEDVPEGATVVGAPARPLGVPA